jgi:hypothetical protein
VKTAAAVLCAVLLAHSVYYLWPAGSADRRWAKYVGDGAGFAVLCIVLALQGRRAGTGVGALVMAAGTWGALEGMQQAGCAVLGWGRVTTRDLCVELVGPWPYVLAASALLAWLISRNKR